MKIYIVILFSLLAFNTFSMAQNVELSTSKVGLKENRIRLNSYDNGHIKTIQKTKDYSIKITSRKEMTLVLFFWVVEGTQVKHDMFVEKIDAKNPFIHTSSASASKRSVLIEFNRYNWGDDYVEITGNDRIDACLFVYNVENGKLVSTKYVSKASFPDLIKKNYGKKMEDIVKEIKVELAKKK